MAEPSDPSGSIAVVGLSCRLPGNGESIQSFWQSICRGESAWSEIPQDRFNPDDFWIGPDKDRKKRSAIITRGGHFLKEDPGLFDAGFFSMPSAEAAAMDPQQRLLAEVAYEALESAGLPLGEIAGSKTGVFVGHFTSDYKEMIFLDPDSAPTYTLAGTQTTSMSGRLSWLWDLRGPSFTVDTACSSSLVALHVAFQSLRAGECDMAVVAGMNLMLTHEMFRMCSNQHLLGADGRSKAFDASGDGYGRGEGFAVVVLKRVEDAVANRDPIRAVIRGTACNQDGHTKGLTMPSSEAQASLIREAYRSAGVSFDETGYLEAHGTGTQAGDTEETKATFETLSADSVRAGKKLLIGSVKSNIGHLEAGAGLAAVIKSVLVLEQGVIPPTISMKTPNPKIPFDDWNLKVPTTLTQFPGDGVRRVSVNSFGYAGTNAHAVFEDAHHYLTSRGIQNGVHYTVPPKTRGKKNVGHTNGVNGHHTNGVNGKTNGVNGHHNATATTTTTTTTTKQRLLAISAQDKDGVQRVRRVLAEFLQSKPRTLPTPKDKEDYFADLAYTLNQRRSHHQWKAFAVASSLGDLADVLEDTETAPPPQRVSKEPRLGFVFTGQGAQWAGMGMELMAYKAFRDSVQAADRYLRGELGCDWSAEEELRRPKGESHIGAAIFSQTLCTVLQVALVDLLREWNVVPVAVTGHSSGEMGAAYALGALSAEDAWKVAYFRGLLSASLKKDVAPEMEGAMMAAGASPEKAAELIARVAPGEVVVACINSPTSVTLSGDAVGIDRLLDALAAEGIFARKLQVDTAYHSHHMQMLAAEYMDAIYDVVARPAAPGCVFYSSATASVVSSSELGPAHWVRNLVSPVRFAEAVQDLVRPRLGKSGKRASENAVDILVEIGPHSALQGPSLQSLKAVGVTNVPYLSTLVRNEHGVANALHLAGNLFAQSYPVNLSKVNSAADESLSHAPKTLVDLPKYPWNHSQRYWAETRLAREHRKPQLKPRELLGAPMPTTVAGEFLWRGHLRLSEEPWMGDHKIQGTVLYPGAGFLAMALEAALQLADPSRKAIGIRLRDIQLVAPMVVTEDADLEFTIVMRPHLASTRDTESTWTEFTISSSPDGKGLQRNCLGLSVVEYDEAGKPWLAMEEDFERERINHRFDEAAGLCRIPTRPEDFYRELASIGLGYGPAFTNVTSVKTRPGQSSCTVAIPDVGLRDKPVQRPHILHPTVLDAVFHMAFAAVNGVEGRKLTAPMIPKSIDQVVVSLDIPYQAGEQLTGYCDARLHGLKEFLADMTMLDKPGGRAVLQIAALHCTSVAGETEGEKPPARKVCSKAVWKPAVQLLEPEEQLRAVELAVAEAVEAAEGSPATAVAKLSELISLMYHHNPSMSIVEIASTAQILLPQLAATNGETFAAADYSVCCADDETKSVIQQALSETVKLSYKLSDVQVPVAAADDKKAHLILANLLSAENPESMLQDAVKLLSDEGKICLTDGADSADRLSALLQSAGLRKTLSFADAGRVVVVGDRGDHQAETATQSAATEVFVVQGPKPSAVASAVEKILTTQLQTLGFRVSTLGWDTSSQGALAETVKEKTVISLVELDRSLLEDLQEADFYQVKDLMLQPLRLFWVTGGDRPTTAMAAGMARVIRNEVPGLQFGTLIGDAASLASPERFAKLVTRVFSAPTADNEFRVLDGLLHVSRYVEDDELNDEMEVISGTGETKIDQLPLGQVTHPLKLGVGTPGMLDSLQFEPDYLPYTELKSDEIELDVKASSLNFREVMVVMGLIPDKTLGFEAAGIVRRIGSAVTNVKIGDRVALIGTGAHSTVFRGLAAYAMPMTDSQTFEQAASFPVVAATAWYGLVHLARVEKGQSILIHAGAGGVGQMAIQVAKATGMEIFTTVGSEAKRKLLRDEYGIPDDHIFHSRDLSFVRAVKRMTGGRGVDVVINSLAGELQRQSWHCLAPLGYFIEIGLKDVLANTRLDMRPFLNNATFSFFNLKDIWDHRVSLMTEIVRQAAEFLRKGILRPIVPTVTFPLRETEKAMRLLQTGKHTGKLVLSYQPDTVVPVVRAPSATLRLDPSAAYLLVGGLGGLGRSLANMLVSNGARKLCFLSRSGGSSDKAQRMLGDLAAQGVQVRAYAADAADAQALEKALQLCRSELGPVRGVFQCAMVLHDVLFANMTYQEWRESTRPKVQGTLNLSEALPDVDFFIILSSFAGIFGNRGQTNYAAGCASQDAIAHARRAKGQHAVSVDVGIMRDVGVLAEGGAVGDIKDWEAIWGIREAEFLGLMKLCMAGDMANTMNAQVVTGLATRGAALDNGITPPYYLDEDVRFAILSRTGVSGTGGAGAASADAGNSVQALLPRVTSAAEAAEVVADALVQRVAKMLQMPAGEIDTNRFLHTYGVDSLAAIEIVNWSLKEVQARIAVFDVMAAIPITAFAAKVAAKSGLLPKELAESGAQ